MGRPVMQENLKDTLRMGINFEQTSEAANNVHLIVVYVSGVVCGLRMSQIIMGFFSVYLNYNTGLIELYYLSVTGLTQQGDFGLYIRMG